MLSPEFIRSLEHELKYALPAHRAKTLEAALRQRCQPDPRYPKGLVTSIYYDTPRLHLVREKVNSDYLKIKIRLRWYADVDGSSNDGRAFAEAKYRIGSRRRKIRVPTRVEGSWLSRQSLTCSRLTGIPNALRQHGVMMRQPLLPVITIRYQRHRFIEPFSGVRVSIDTAISASQVNPQLGTSRALRPLTAAVVEVKGKSSRLPVNLRLLAALGCRQTSFSKYCACFEAATGVEL